MGTVVRTQEEAANLRRHSQDSLELALRVVSEDKAKSDTAVSDWKVSWCTDAERGKAAHVCISECSNVLP